MKKQLLSFFMLLCVSTISWGFNVTFKVDMSNVTGFTTANVNGTFNNWCGACAAMTDADSDNIWEITIDLPAGSYEYKFTADGWSQQENLTSGSACTVTNFGFTNRTITVTGDTVLPTVCWGACSSCTSVYPVTFKVDMTNVTQAYTSVQVPGSFNGWTPTANSLTDANADGIYETTINLSPGTYEYKFAADNWNIQESLTQGSSCTVTNFGYTNRTITVTSAGQVLDAVCWGACVACSAVAPTYNVTFKVDMSQTTGFTTPELNGTFNGWCGNCTAMSDANSDGIWEVTVPLQAGSYEYKFAHDNWAGSEQLTEGSSCTVTADGFTNRLLVVTGNTILDPVCYGSCSACIVSLPGCTNSTAANYNAAATTDDGSCLYATTFNVDMSCSNETFSTVHVTGPWCGWCAGESYNTMSDSNSDGIYTVVVNLPAGNVEYKYMVNGFASQENLIDDMQNGGTCAVVTDYWSYANRQTTAGSTNDNTYGSCTACAADVPGCNDATAVNYNSIATVNDGSCLYATTFNVDMSCSGENYSTVHVTGPWCGWCGGESYNTMSDSNNDGVYTVTVNLPAGNVEYKYMINGFASQENLIDDMQNGGTCAVVTDYWSYANRQTTAGTTNDNTYGSCSSCCLNLTYYTDADGDGQGSGNAQILCAVPTSGFATTGGDCNDSNAAINSTATEVCGNAIDENCDGIAATCGDDYSTPVNVASMGQFGVGTQTSFVATLGSSSDSPETSFTGNDRWFKFTATSNAVRVAIAGNSSVGDDNKIAIYDYVANPSGALIPLAEEDDVHVGSQGIATDAGSEVLLYDGLVVGNQYMVAIANTNSAADNVTVTMSRLSASNPDIAPYTNYTNTYTSACQSFKAAYKPSAVAYIVNRWSSASVNGTPEWSYTIGGTSNVTVCQLGKIVVPNFSGSTQTINVSVDVTYSLKDAYGNTTLVTAVSGTTQSFGLADEASLSVRSYDQCPAYKNAISGSIATNRSVCGVSRYSWQFTQQVPVVNLPISVEGALGGSRILSLSSVAGMANGQRYDVDIKVKHVDNATYSEFDGTASCVRTLGAAGMETEENLASWKDENREIKLYPNPSNGNSVNVSLAGFDGQVNMEVFDYTGKKVNATTLNVDGSLQQVIEWNNNLSAGMYQVIFTNGAERVNVTMMVFK
ncbi:MAG: hypothetical protein RL106_947 [Bacteroidota bacterium]|jgi:hypothetical protein